MGLPLVRFELYEEQAIRIADERQRASDGD
jgi:hypothetical protein